MKTLRILFRLLIGAVLAAAMLPAFADIHFGHHDDDDEPKWQEGEYALPDFPKDADLMEFYVSAVTPNHFFIDGKSISAGADGVVRFTLVVKTAGGATNVTFEGIRCGEMEHRLYATGRADGTWVKARRSEWLPIENRPINRYYASLSRDYFCPSGVPIRDADDGRNALRLGKHPDAK
jgi:hypothetical protein